MTASQVYAHAAEAYREGLNTVNSVSQTVPVAAPVAAVGAAIAEAHPELPAAASSVAHTVSNSNVSADMTAFVQRLSARMGSLWNESLVPSAHALYRHMQEVHGQATTMLQPPSGGVYTGRLGASDAQWELSVRGFNINEEMDDVNHVNNNQRRGGATGSSSSPDIDLLLD